MSGDDLPISLTAADLERIDELKDLLADHEAGSEAHALLNRLVEDLDTSQMIHRAVLDHATELENDLSDKNAQINALIDKMKRYLSEQLYQQIVGGQVDTTAGSHKRVQLTVFFSDIVGFTDITDTLEPETLSFVLNSYLNEMARICSQYGGAIDKFIGDAVMIYFGDDDERTAQESARACVHMALQMQQSMEALRARWAEEGCRHPLKMRIGINSGYCTVGNFGSDERMDYTLIGGNVNIAARLEGQCPHGGILVSETTHQLIEDVIESEPFGTLELKGVSRPVITHQVLGKRDADPQAGLFRDDGDGFRLDAIHYDPDHSSSIELRQIRESLEQALKRLSD